MEQQEEIRSEQSEQPVKRGRGRPKGSKNIPPELKKPKKDVGRPPKPPTLSKQKKPPVVKAKRDTKHTDRTKQYWIVRETMKRIKWGWSKAEVYEWLDTDTSINTESKRIYYKAALAAIDSRLTSQAKDIAEVNKARLEAIFDESVEIGDRKSALKAIDMLNKMAGLYVEQLKIDTPIFEIKIDGQNINNIAEETDNTTSP